LFHIRPHPRNDPASYLTKQFGDLIASAAVDARAAGHIDRGLDVTLLKCAPGLGHGIFGLEANRRQLLSKPFGVGVVAGSAR
jgi:hypothetical protein